MSGGGGPRQKMINMMYLVLTAMLALNVSAEILNAFTKIDIGLGQTAEISIGKNKSSIDALEETIIAEPEKADKIKPWLELASNVRGKTDELYEYIQSIKIELVKKADGEHSPALRQGRLASDSIESLDNSTIVDEYMIGISRNGKAYELHEKIQEYKDYIINDILIANKAKMPVVESLIEEIDGLLNFHFKVHGATDLLKSWEEFTFESTPLIATIATLSKLQVDALNCESSVLEVLRNSIDAKTFKIKEIGVAVNNPQSVLVKNQSSEAEIFLAAFDPTIAPVAIVNGTRHAAGSDGKIRIKYNGNSLGPQTIRGHVEFMGPDGKQTKNFEIPFQVIEPALVVSPTKMNVFYLDVDNPVDISVSGVPDDKISVSVQNGTYNQSSKSIRPGAMGECTVSASANINGTQHNMGTRKFRVKRVPTPIAAVHGIAGKSVGKGELAASQGVVAKMPEDFDFDLKFTVTGFTVGVMDGGFFSEASSSNQTFSQEQRNLLGRLKSGATVAITGIKAQGPGGVRALYDLVLKVK